MEKELDNNQNKFLGIISEKPIRYAKGKAGTKNEGKNYEFKSIILEIKYRSGNQERTTFPEVQLGSDAFDTFDTGFDIGDKVVVGYNSIGKRISDTWHKTELWATYIQHADVNYNDTRTFTKDKPFKKDKSSPTPVAEEDDSQDQLPF